MISTGCSNASQSIGAMGSYGVETMQASGADLAQGEGSRLQPPDSIARELHFEATLGIVITIQHPYACRPRPSTSG